MRRGEPGGFSVSNQRGVKATPAFDAKRWGKRPSGLHDGSYLESLQKAYVEKVTSLHAEAEGLGNKELPAFKHKNEIVSAVKHNKAIALGGPTGSGKSTQAPQFLLDVGRVSFNGEAKRDAPFKKLFMLVPRKNIANGLYERIVSELSETFGKEKALEMVGLIHGDKTILPDNCVLEIMTSNTYILRSKDIAEQYADEKVGVITDEMHESNVYTDAAFALVAKEVHHNDHWRLVAASATHNIDNLQGVLEKINGGHLEVVNIEGRPFNVDVREAPEQTPMEVYAEMGHEHKKSLIFTSGKAQLDCIIEETRGLLKKSKQDVRDVIFYKFHGDMTEFAQEQVNRPIPEGKRAVIVATPAAMSGRTFPGTSLVITDGTINRQTFDDNDMAEGLPRDFLSTAEIIQQMGRAGRDVGGGVGVLAQPVAVMKPKNVEGRVYDGFHSIEGEGREAFGPPEILHSNLSQLVLEKAALDIDFNDLLEYLPTRVSATTVSNAKEMLSRIGALDDEYEITETGRLMSRIPLRPELSRGVVETYRKNRTIHQLARVALIAAALDAGGVQSRLSDEIAWKQLLEGTGAKDDLEAQLKLLTDLPEDSQDRRHYISSNNLNKLRLDRTLKVAGKILKTLGIGSHAVNLGPATPSEYDELRTDLTAGMIDFVFRQVSDRDGTFYQNILGGEYATKREIGRDSVVRPHHSPLILASPYNFILDRTGEEVPVVTWGVETSPDAIAYYANQYNLGKVEDVRSTYSAKSGRVVETGVLEFGGIAIGPRRNLVPRDQIPKASQQVLVDAVWKCPGDNLRALKQVSDEFKQYRERLPDKKYLAYFRPNHPPVITDEIIREEMEKAAEKYRDAHKVDAHLRTFMYHRGIEISRYLTEENRAKLRAMTPDEIEIDELDFPVKVIYKNGAPYVIGKPNVIEALKGKGPLVIPGRDDEVKVQLLEYTEKGDSRKVQVSASTL